MGLREDLERFREVGEEHRQDLTEFIKHGEIDGGDIQIPIKIIELPSFDYDEFDRGGVGKGEAEVGDALPSPGDGEGDKAGEGSGEHGHYKMDPEEFAQELDEELGLDLEPKGKTIKEVTEGAMVDMARSGPESTLDFERMWKKGLKRSMAMYFDEEYIREVLCVEGMGPSTAFEWAREENIPISKGWLETEYADIPSDEKQKYESIDEIPGEYQSSPHAKDIDSVALREEDKRHKYPEITKEYEKNAVVVFIRDVSGSMGEHKRDLVERIFTPLDWYLTGKYDNAEFIYIVHDAEAWEVERRDFFGIESGGGTKISSAYELAKKELESRYPWEDWNRYVFASGDGENWRKDSRENVIPLMEEIDANLHAYLQVEDAKAFLTGGGHADIVEEEMRDKNNVAVAYAEDKDDVMACIYAILSTEDSEE